jgi:hypothetical protein
MRRDAQPPTGGIYCPRNPRVSPLYQCVRHHAVELNEAGLVQTFGDLVTFNPHIHALVADGVFLPSGTLRQAASGAIRNDRYIRLEKKYWRAVRTTW